MFPKSFIPALTLLAAFLPPAGNSLAAEELDDVLSGFDEPAAPKTDQHSSELEDALSGFDSGEPAGADARSKDIPELFPSWLNLFGSLTESASWNYCQNPPRQNEPDYRGLSMLKTTAALGADITTDTWKARLSGHVFYDAAWSLTDRHLYSDKFLSEYETETEIDELYVTASPGDDLDIKAGRQVVVWGKADNVRVTDVLNPLDNRTPGMVDIKYKRLPVTMSKLDYYFSNWDFSAIVIHEIRFDKTPVYNSAFFQADKPAPPEKEPTDFSLNSQQYAFALNGIFNGWDLSLYQAFIYDGRAHVTVVDDQPYRVHNRVSMTGMTTNLAWGNFLLKAEGAWWQGLEFANNQDRDFDRLDVMAGLEYTGFSETVMSVEIVDRHLFHYDNSLSALPDATREDSWQTALMLTRDFLNDTLTLKILATLFGSQGDDGGFERLQLEYDYNDHISLTGGLVLYQNGDQPGFQEIKDNDRIFIECKYAF